jgi:hypothetical protein
VCSSDLPKTPKPLVVFKDILFNGKVAAAKTDEVSSWGKLEATSGGDN